MVPIFLDREFYTMSFCLQMSKGNGKKSASDGYIVQEEQEFESPAPLKHRRPRKYVNESLQIKALSSDELDAVKAVILDSMARDYDREAAVKAAGITLRALRLLLAQDGEFREKFAALKNADDDILADAARSNLKQLLMQGNVTVTLYVDKTRGGYEKKGRVVEEANKLPIPVDQDGAREKPPLRELALVKPDPLPEKAPDEGSAHELDEMEG